MGLPPRGPSVSRGTEKVRALRDLLDAQTRSAPEPRFATDWPAWPVRMAAGFGKYGVQCLCGATASAGSYATAVSFISAPKCEPPRR